MNLYEVIRAAPSSSSLVKKSSVYGEMANCRNMTLKCNSSKVVTVPLDYIVIELKTDGGEADDTTNVQRIIFFKINEKQLSFQK